MREDHQATCELLLYFLALSCCQATSRLQEVRCINTLMLPHLSFCVD